MDDGHPIHSAIERIHHPVKVKFYFNDELANCPNDYQILFYYCQWRKCPVWSRPLTMWTPLHCGAIYYERPVLVSSSTNKRIHNVYTTCSILHVYYINHRCMLFDFRPLIECWAGEYQVIIWKKKTCATLKYDQSTTN